MPKHSSTQKDTQKPARSILDQVVPDAKPVTPGKEKNPAAVALGQVDGLKGGKARATRLTAGRRTEIAKKAAAFIWRKKS
jgi:hypothetical protein